MESKQVITQETLVNLVNRLELLVSKLEGTQNTSNTNQNTNLKSSSPIVSTEKITVYTDYWNKTLQNLLALKKCAEETKKQEIEHITELVIEGLCFQQDVLIASETFKKPQGKDLQELVKKYSVYITKLTDITKEKRDFALHCEAVRSSLDALCWMFNENSCDAICQTYFESIEYPGNKLFMQKIPEVTAWVKSLKLTIKEVNELVKLNYKSGVKWSVEGVDDVNGLLFTLGNTYRKNYKKDDNLISIEEKKPVEPVAPVAAAVVKKEETQKPIKDLLTSGELRKSLRPVTNNNTKEEVVSNNPQPVKKEENSEKKEESVVATSSFVSTKRKEVKKGRRETIWKKGKKEEYEKIRGSHYYQNLEDEVREIDPEKLETKTILTFNNCYNCTFTANKKINAIKLSNCENVNIICESLISILEIVNCFGIKVQVDGIVRSFTVDGSSEVMFIVYPKCKEAQFITAKSNDIKIRLRKDEDPLDYNEILIPEQFVFQINERRKMARGFIQL